MIERRLEPNAAPPQVYTLRVVVVGVSPMIWRQLVVPADCTLARLHTTLQLAFGWTNYYLHQILIHGREFGSLGEPAASARLAQFRLRRREKFAYVYNLTDYWRCEVRLVEIGAAQVGAVYPICVGGRRAAPPEDCGGPEAYMSKLEEHRYHPPLEALGVLAEAMRRLVDAPDEQSVREAVGDLDEIRDAVDRLRAYDSFEPGRFRRQALNARLRSVDANGAHT